MELHKMLCFREGGGEGRAVAEWLFVLLICIFPSTFHLLEDNFPAFSGPDWYHFSGNDSFYFPPEMKAVKFPRNIKMDIVSRSRLL